MRIAGIIAEYNPFHNGHMYHVEQAKAQTGCDFIVAVMDGNFTQRGEPAALSKWSRARMALNCGVDAVFELPTLFAVRTADTFARSGVLILNGLGVDYISFGCETDDMTLLNALVDVKRCEPMQVSQGVVSRLGQGMSHAKAWGEAAAAYLDVAPEAINRPNTILGVEYLRAMKDIESNMQPCPVRRVGEYHDESMGDIASASAIRQAVRRGDDRAKGAVPTSVRGYLSEMGQAHGLDDVMLMKLRAMNEHQLRALPDVSEGLERRVMKLCGQAPTREALIAAAKGKRYTYARISRLLAHALLDISCNLISTCPRPSYARLLGMRDGAGPLLKELSERTRLPIISSASQLKDEPAFAVECRASDIWALGRNAEYERCAGREYTEKFIVI